MIWSLPVPLTRGLRLTVLLTSYSIHFECEVKALVTQLCPTLCDPMDCSPPGSSVHGIFQARILEWVANFLLQGTFLTQGLNPSLLHWQVDSLPLSHLESPAFPLEAAEEIICPSSPSAMCRKVQESSQLLFPGWLLWWPFAFSIQKPKLLQKSLWTAHALLMPWEMAWVIKGREAVQAWLLSFAVLVLTLNLLCGLWKWK